jgi:hypothetical protein
MRRAPNAASASRSAVSRSVKPVNPTRRAKVGATGLFTFGSASRMSWNATSAASTWRVVAPGVPRANAGSSW